MLDIRSVVKSLASQDPAARLEACENLTKLHYYKHSQNDMLRGQLLETEDLIPNLLLLLSNGYKNLTYHGEYC